MPGARSRMPGTCSRAAPIRTKGAGSTGQYLAVSGQSPAAAVTSAAEDWWGDGRHHQRGSFTWMATTCPTDERAVPC